MNEYTFTQDETGFPIYNPDGTFLVRVMNKDAAKILTDKLNEERTR